MVAGTQNRAIHVVDDDPNVLDSLTMLLHFMGHAPHAYASGRDFLDTAHIEHGDLLLFDLHMPDIDGFSLLKQLQAQHTNLRALLMTGHGNADVEREAENLGFQAVLHKPFSEIDLRTALDAAAA